MEANELEGVLKIAYWQARRRSRHDSFPLYLLGAQEEAAALTQRSNMSCGRPQPNGHKQLR